MPKKSRVVTEHSDQNEILIELMMQRRRGIKFSSKKPTRQQIPLGLERQYARIIRDLLNKVVEEIRLGVLSQLPLIVNENDLNRKANRDSERFDQTISEKIGRLFQATRLRIGQTVTDNEVGALVAVIAQQTGDFQKKQIGRAIKSVLGIDLFVSEPFIGEVSEAFIRENVSLIKNVTEEFTRQTERVVFEGVRRGQRASEISQRILGTVKDKQGLASTLRKAKNRANLIARDQINKFNGKLNEERQTSAGIDSYKWRTAKDERVRTSHRQREGIEFSWDEPPSDGHPGEPINCRCFAEPIFEDADE